MSAPEVAPVRSTNVRRSMVTMLIGLAGLSTPLATQETRGGGMVTFGLAYTVGSGWQIQGFDVGYGRGMRSGPIAALSLSARLGEFIDQRAIIGGSQGFVFGATLAARSRALTIAEFGADTAPSRVGLDVTVETTGYAGAHSPLGIGSPWGAVSVLPGLRVGQFGLVLGPTAFSAPPPSSGRSWACVSTCRWRGETAIPSFATDGGPLPRYRASRYPGHCRSGVGAAGGSRVWGRSAWGGERAAARPQPPSLSPLAPHT